MEILWKPSSPQPVAKHYSSVCCTRGTFLVVFHVNNILLLQTCYHLFSALRKAFVNEENTSNFRSNVNTNKTRIVKSMHGHIHMCSATGLAIWRCSFVHEGYRHSAKKGSGSGSCLSCAFMIMHLSG